MRTVRERIADELQAFGLGVSAMTALCAAQGGTPEAREKLLAYITENAHGVAARVLAYRPSDSPPSDPRGSE